MSSQKSHQPNLYKGNLINEGIFNGKIQNKIDTSFASKNPNNNQNMVCVPAF